nr:TonB-dependent receptor [Alcaligenes faecalis]
MAGLSAPANSGLDGGAGVRYRGKSPNDVRPDGSLNYNPSFTLADMAVAYETSRYRVALNVNNVFNKKYYTGQFRGMEREVMLNMNLYW